MSHDWVPRRNRRHKGKLVWESPNRKIYFQVGDKIMPVHFSLGSLDVIWIRRKVISRRG